MPMTQAQPDVHADGLRYASFWDRAVAVLIDWLIVLPLGLGVLWVPAWSRTAAVTASMTLIAAGLAYRVYFHGRWGQTVGKMARGIRVVRPDGSRISWAQSWIRVSVDLALEGCGALIGIAAIPSMSSEQLGSMSWLELSNRIDDQAPMHDLLGTVGAIWMVSEIVVILCNQQRRAIHDFMAGTVVIRGAATVAPSDAKRDDERRETLVRDLLHAFLFAPSPFFMCFSGCLGSQLVLPLVLVWLPVLTVFSLLFPLTWLWHMAFTVPYFAAYRLYAPWAWRHIRHPVAWYLFFVPAYLAYWAATAYLWYQISEPVRMSLLGQRG
jgi:uncharacterized RDD family membrane protein YckC